MVRQHLNMIPFSRPQFAAFVLTRSYLLVIFFLVVSVFSCSPRLASNPTTRANPTTDINEIGPAINAIELQRQYMTGSSSEAEKALRDVISGLVSDPNPTASTHDQFVSHARLHVLAKLRKNDPLAACEFVKAKYWFLLQQEQADNLRGEKLAAALNEFSERECDRRIIEWDQAISKNIGIVRPKYWDELVGKNITCDQWIISIYGN